MLFSDLDLHNIEISGIEIFNDINVSNLKTNENDMEVIANILYNDMNVLLLIVGFTLFISLIIITRIINVIIISCYCLTASWRHRPPFVRSNRVLASKAPMC